MWLEKRGEKDNETKWRPSPTCLHLYCKFLVSRGKGMGTVWEKNRLNVK